MAEQTVGLKDRNLQAYYEALLALYSMPGWTYLMEDLQKIHEAGNTLKGIGSMEELHFRRGQLDIIETIVAQPAVTSAAYDLLIEEDKS
jgi:hypothetical protein